MDNKYDNGPIYVAVLNTIRDQILNGELRPGDMLPSEKELCLRFSATRATVRKGLNELENLGFIRSNPGKGSFVIQPRMSQFTFTVNDEYPDCDIEILGARLITPDDNIRRALKLSPGGQAYQCSRIMRQNGMPVALDMNYVSFDPTRMAAEQAEEFVLFSRINAASDTPFAFSNHAVILAEGATEEVARLLECPVNEPLLVITRFLFGPNNSRRGFGRKFLLNPYGQIHTSSSYLPDSQKSNVFNTEFSE